MTLHLKDVLGSFVEDDDPKPQQPKEVAQLIPITQTNVGVMPPPSVTVNLDADHSDDAYQRLLAKTDLSTDPVFQKINKYLTPIASLALDEKTKFKIAIQQAQAQDGVQADAILAVFDQFKNVLQQASDVFAQNAQKAIAAQVDAKKAQAAELSKQIQDLQAQVAQLTEDAFNAQQKIQAAQHRFDTALATRQNELAQEHAKYVGLLA